jgi:acyl carrier protein
MAQHGIGSIPPDKALEALRRMLAEDSTQLTVLPVNWTQWRESNPAMSESPVLAGLAREDIDPTLDSLRHGGKHSLTRDALLKAEPAERPGLLEANLCQHVGRLLMLPTSKFDAHQPLDVLGIDSLMALQLKNVIEIELGVVVPVVKLLQGPTIAELVTTILEQMQAALPPASAAGQAATEAGTGEGQTAEKISRARPELATGYVAPRHPTEEMLAGVLAGVLGFERVGIDDDFFELHSLTSRGDSGSSEEAEAAEASLARDIATRVQQVFQVSLDPDSVRAAPTVAGLNVTVVRKQAEGLDEEELSLMLAELGELSEDEAQSMLAVA